MADAPIPRGIDHMIIDQAIASGVRLLKFPGRLEAAFGEEIGRNRCRQLAIGGVVGVLAVASGVPPAPARNNVIADRRLRA